MNIIIVKTKQQRQDAYHVRTKVFVEEQNVPAEIEIDELEEEAIHFVAYDEEKAVGAGRLRFVDEFAKVERICVLKSHRGLGVGDKIMNYIENVAMENGFTHLKLNAQMQAENFYKKLGYETVSGQFLDAGIPHVTMTKETANS